MTFSQLQELELARWHLSACRYEQVAEILQVVLTRDPVNVQGLWLSAQAVAMQGDWRGAAECLTKILAINPNDIHALQRLVEIGEACGNPTLVEACQRRLIAAEPGNPARLYNLACLLQNMGRGEEAIDHYRRALVLNPRFTQAYNNLGNILMSQGRHAEAAACYEGALRIDATLLEAHYNLALTRQQLGCLNEAGRSFARALELAPTFAPAMLGIGSLLHDRHDYQGALAWYERAAAADPGDIEALYNLGTLCLDLERYDEALDYFRRALVRNTLVEENSASGPLPLEPRLSLVHFNLGRVLRRMDRTSEWLDNYHAYRLPGIDANNLQYGLEVAIHEGNHSEAERLLQSLIDHLDGITDAAQASHLLSLAQYQDVGQEDLLKCYRRFNVLARAVTRGQRRIPEYEAMGSRRIRVGYLSPDFNRHVMGYLMHEVLRRHDRSRFEVHLYYSGKKADELTAGFRGVSDKFVTVCGLTPEQAARRIAEDRLDILVDLAGHTSGGMPLVLAYRPARVQLTHLGYHGALGLDTVDYKLTDAYADLPGNAAYLVEDLLPMAGCLMPFRHQAPAPDGPRREDVGIPEDAIVCGVFVTHRKLSRRCLVAWRSILNRVEGAVLAFSTSQETEKEAIQNNLAAAGIMKSRVAFIPHMGDPAAARARYRIVDIVLDTFPYTGGDTTLAALDMGIPVVTLCGTRQSERVTYSILRNLGVDLGISHSETDYVDLACRLAEDEALRREYARAIVEKLPSSPLADLDAYIRHLEAAYVRALEGARGGDAAPTTA